MVVTLPGRESGNERKIKDTFFLLRDASIGTHSSKDNAVVRRLSGCTGFSAPVPIGRGGIFHGTSEDGVGLGARFAHGRREVDGQCLFP